MNCTQCGTPLAADSRFCPRCGTPVTPAAPFPGGTNAPPPSASSAPPGGSYPPPDAAYPPPGAAYPPPGAAYPPPGGSYPPPPAFPGASGGSGIPPAAGPEGIAIPAPPGMVSECIRAGWAAFQRDWGIFVGMYLVYTVLTAGPDFIVNRTFGEDHPISVSLKIGTSALSIFLYPGFIVAALKAVRGARVDFTDLFAGFRRPGAVLAWSVLGGLATAFGFVLLVVPGIIIGLGLSQAGFLVFDRGMGGIDALQRSWKLMTGYRWPLFLLMLTLIGINILGVLALCVGFFVTAPLTAVVLAVFYERVRQWNGGAIAVA